MATVAVIPARFASTRFPGKPLAKDTGKYLIQHVYERVSDCRAVDRVIIATDDERIVAAVESFGGSACMTRADHSSGTDRVGEVAASLGLAGDDLVLNVQGDEPEIGVSVLETLIRKMGSGDASCRIGTLAAPFSDDGPSKGVGSPLDPNCVKVVVDERGQALYFSRSLIPYPQRTGGWIDRPSRFLLHLGVYAFRVDTLRLITAGGGLRRARLEEAESLEQLRWIEHGLPVAVAIVEHRIPGIDTPEDYAAFVKRISAAAKNVKAEVG